MTIVTQGGSRTTAGLTFTASSVVINPLPVTATEDSSEQCSSRLLDRGDAVGTACLADQLHGDNRLGRWVRHVAGADRHPGITATTEVIGSHVYAESGTYNVRITIGTSSAPSIASTSFPLSVASVPVVLTGGLDPASDSGDFHNDAVTSVTQPIFDGTSEPLSTVKVYVQPTNGSGGPQLVGTTATDASGAWRLQSTVTLANGAYTVVAQAVDRNGVMKAQTQLLPNAATGPLTIDTVGPTVTNVRFNRQTGSVLSPSRTTSPGWPSRPWSTVPISSSAN